MNYYKQLDYPQTQGIDGQYPISEVGSLLVAQCNLLAIMNLGHDIDPVALNEYYQKKRVYEQLDTGVRDKLGWDSLTKYDSTVSVEKINRGWPDEDGALVKFHCQSNEKAYITVDGKDEVPNMIDHYCVMIDAANRMIIDSYDGEIKPAGPYGTPIGYAIYSSPDRRLAVPTKSGNVYIWVEHDNIWDVARRLGVDPYELMEHNDITDYSSIAPGTHLHLFKPRDNKPIRQVRYQVLPEPLPMHISKPGGTKKWSFGNIKTWDDFKSTGFFPENTNVTIVAIAHVPVEDEENPEAEAAYYLDSLALGDYAQTGRVRLTIGYAWSDLSEGHIERERPILKKKPLTPIEVEVAATAALENEPSELAAAVAEEAPVESENQDLNSEFAERNLELALQYGQHAYKQTYQLLDQPVPCMALIPDGEGETDEKTGQRFIWVHEYDGQRPDRRLAQHQEVWIGGTFEYDGSMYGRPAVLKEGSLITTPYWFGVPMDLLISQAELYNPVVDVSTRAAVHGHLTLTERLLTEPLSKLVNNPRYRRHFQKITNKHKQTKRG